MNDTDRTQWIENDEGLYNWKRSTRLSMREFLKQNRQELDRIIGATISGKKQPHHLAYGSDAGKYPPKKWYEYGN